MKKNIFLLSDQIVHWNILPTASGKNVYSEGWGIDSTLRIMDQLKDYFEKQGSPLDWSLLSSKNAAASAGNLNPCDDALNHAFATWKQFPEGKQKAWRINEIVHVGQSTQSPLDNNILQNIEKSDLIIFQDWGMDIRHFQLPGLAKALQDKWTLYRCYPPVFEGSLWDEVQKGSGSKKILLLRVDDLRKLNSSISRGLSWEQTIQDIINEIYFKQNISLHPLRTMEYLLISFGCTATLLIHNPQDGKTKQPCIRFFFDAMGIEGYWEKNHPGYLPGDLEFLAALLAKDILYPADAKALQLEKAVRAHLLVRRELLSIGSNVAQGSLAFESLPAQLDKVYGTKPTQDFTPVELDFAFFQSLFEEQQDKTNPSTKDWSLLGLTRWDLYSLARKIALYGPMQALSGWNIPIAKYNFLLTVDRKEIEFLHNLKTLISEYLQNKNDQPLSIAVFGAPGSGKSFSIKQLAKTLDIPGHEIKDITFNLSQFNEDNPTDLYQAFHAVRDISLSGKTPLVFWDEFDSKDLAWLRYFLAPMQDGEFQEGQLTHNIGKSIFVFAGGTCSCMQQFEEKAHAAISEKGPDFLSRLKGFINVMGPNPQLPYNADATAASDVDERMLLQQAKNADPEYIVRRAILINSLLNINYHHLFNEGILQIDDGVLNALLMTPKYKHGTRSMETIFKTSQLFGKHKYHRSDLPPQSQMDLHVDGQHFYDLITREMRICDGGEAFYHLVNEINLDEKVIDRMAVGIHAIYSLVFSSGKEKDPLSITQQEFSDAYKTIREIPEETLPDEVSQNYHNARKIPEKLAAVGCSIVPLNAPQKAYSFTPEEFELVSRLEHIRWVQQHIDTGWCYASKKDKSKKLHDALVAWDEEERKNVKAVYGNSYAQKMGTASGKILSEHYRNLDRVITLAIPWILEDVGYKMVKAK